MFWDIFLFSILYLSTYFNISFSAINDYALYILINVSFASTPVGISRDIRLCSFATIFLLLLSLSDADVIFRCVSGARWRAVCRVTCAVGTFGRGKIYRALLLYHCRFSRLLLLLWDIFARWWYWCARFKTWCGYR